MGIAMAFKLLHSKGRCIELRVMAVQLQQRWSGVGDSMQVCLGNFAVRVAAK